VETAKSPSKLTDLIPLIDELMDMARRSSRMGLAVLEKYRDSKQDPILQKGLELLLRGTESENIERIFNNLLEACDYTPFERAYTKIVLEAMICLCRRDPMDDMEDILFSVIGDQGREEHLKKKIEKRRTKIKNFLNIAPSAENEGSESGRKLQEFSDRQLIMLMEQVSLELLAPFLAGESHSLQCRIINMLDERSQSDLIDQLDMGFLDISIEKSRKLVSYRIRRIAGEFKDEEILSQKEVDALLKSKN